jgi:hypothetical protein
VYRESGDPLTWPRGIEPACDDAIAAASARRAPLIQPLLSWPHAHRSLSKALPTSQRAEKALPASSSVGQLGRQVGPRAACRPPACKSSPHRHGARLELSGSGYPRDPPLNNDVRRCTYKATHCEQDPVVWRYPSVCSSALVVRVLVVVPSVRRVNHRSRPSQPSVGTHRARCQRVSDPTSLYSQPIESSCLLQQRLRP